MMGDGMQKQVHLMIKRNSMKRLSLLMHPTALLQLSERQLEITMACPKSDRIVICQNQHTCKVLVPFQPHTVGALRGNAGDIHVVDCNTHEATPFAFSCEHNAIRTWRYPLGIAAVVSKRIV